MYEYQAKCTYVVDGDTVDLEFDLGFHLKFKARVRLGGIDTPEIRGSERPEGLVAKQYVVDKILNKSVVVKTNKDKKGKYGRYIATIFYDGIDLNAELVEKGLATKYGS